MKKFYFLTMAALVALFSFTACSEGGDDNETPAKKTALAKPVLTVENVTADGFTAIWSAVPNAANYTYELNGEAHTTTNTRAPFVGLEAGDYTLRVKANPAANSNKYESSDWASTIVTIESSEVDAEDCDWFEQTLFTYEYESYNPTNSLFFGYRGTGVTEILYGLFPSSVLEGESQETIIEHLNNDFTADDIAAINTEEGAMWYIGGLTPSTSYTLCTYATNAAGQSVFMTSTCSTEAAEANPMRDGWLGSWNATMSKTVTWDVPAGSNYAEFTFAEKESNFEVTIEADESYPNTVYIYGLTNFDPSVPAIGEVSESGELYIFSGIQMAEADEDGYAPYWISICNTPQGSQTMLNDEFPAYTMTLSGNTATSTLFSQNGYEFLHMEIYAVNPTTGGVSFYVQGLPVTYKAGALTLTRANATMSKSVKKALRMGKKSPVSWERNTNYVIAL